MRLVSFARRLSGVLVVAALAACEDVYFIEPSTLPAEFTLSSVNDDVLPATLSTEGGVRYDLVSEKLTFQDGGKVTRTRVIRRTTVATGAHVDESSTLQVEYRFVENQLEVGWFTPCPPNAMCIGNDVGVYQEQRVQLLSQLYHIGNQPARLVYHRAD